MLKRYLAFRGAYYYPSPGMEDFIGDFDSVEEAIAFVVAAEKSEVVTCAAEFINFAMWTGSWGCVWDSETKETVWDQTNYVKEIKV